MKNTRYLFAAFIAYLIWGFFSFGLKPISSYNPLDILFYRLYLSVFCLLIINFLFRKKIIIKDYNLYNHLDKKNKRKIFLLIIGGAIILMLNWLSFIFVMNKISVQAASLSYLVCPILTTVLARVILKEELNMPKYIAVGIGVFACLVLSFGNLHALVFSLIVAFTFALYIIIQRSLKLFDSFTLLMTQLTIVAILMLPLVMIDGVVIPKEPIFYKCIALVVVLFTIIPMFLNNYALTKVNSSTVGIMIYINPITNFLLAFFYYRENVNMYQIIGYSLIFIAIIIFNFNTIFGVKKEAIK